MKVLALLVLLSAASAPAAAGTPPVPVTAATVQTHDVAIIREGLGTVQALNTATIRAQVSGQLTEIAFKEGQFVKKGQLIAQIDPAPFQAAVDQAVATRARDTAILANSRRNLGRTAPLANRGYATNQQLDTQSSVVDQGESTLKIDEAQIAAARTQLGFTSIVAPFDGILGLRLVDIGNIVHPADQNGIVVLTQVRPISIVFALPSTDIPAVQDALARGAVTATAYAADDKTILDTGVLLLINNQADRNSGTVQLKARFPNTRNRLWPGTFVNVHVVVDTRKNGLTVPSTSVQQGPNGLFVYMVGGDDTVHITPVTVGQARNGETLINGGLGAGARVVTEGQYGLAEGVKVAVVSGEVANQVRSSTSASAGMLP